MVIILNARAGSVARNPGKTRSKVAALFGELGAHPQIIVAEGKDVGAIVRQAVVGNEETIVAGGGDGTVSTVAAEVAGTGITLGVLPLGTFNHFARDLRIPFRLEGAVRVLVGHHIVAVDVAEVNGRVFVNNSGLGIYPHIVALREAEQYCFKSGKFRALVSATLHVFRRIQFFHLRITRAPKRAGCAKIQSFDPHVDSSFPSALWASRSDDRDAAARFYPRNQPRSGCDLR